MDEPHEATVRDFANRLKTSFSKFKQERMRRGRYHLQPPFDSVLDFWSRVAELCIQLGAEPELLVEAAFAYYSGLPSGPLPNVMVSQKGMSQAWKLRMLKVPKIRQDQAEDPERIAEYMVDTTQDRERRWAVAIDGTGRLLEVKLGTRDLTDLRVIEELRSPTAHYQEWIRLILLPNDPVIWREFGFVAIMQLRRRPELVSWLDQKGLGASQLLHRPMPEKSEHLKFLESTGTDVSVFF